MEVARGGAVGRVVVEEGRHGIMIAMIFRRSFLLSFSTPSSSFLAF